MDFHHDDVGCEHWKTFQQTSGISGPPPPPARAKAPSPGPSGRSGAEAKAAWLEAKRAQAKPWVFEEVEEKLLVAAVHCLHASLVDFNEGYPPVFDEERCYRQRPHIDSQFKDSLHDRRPSTFVAFYMNLLDSTKFQVMHCIISMVYLKRVRDRWLRRDPSESSRLTEPQLPITCWRPLIVTALLIADKVYEDNPVRNLDVVTLFPVITKEELGEMERWFLIDALKFYATFDVVRYNEACNELIGVQANEEIAALVLQHNFVQKLRREPREDQVQESQRLMARATDLRNTDLEDRNEALRCGQWHFSQNASMKSPRANLAQRHALQQGATSKTVYPSRAYPNQVICQSKLNSSRDNTGRQSHSVGSLSTTAASSPQSSVSGRVGSAPPGNGASSANAPPTIPGQPWPRGVNPPFNNHTRSQHQRSLQAVPSMLTVRDGKNANMARGQVASPDREAFRMTQTPKATSPTRNGMATNGTSLPTGHAASTPSMSQQSGSLLRAGVSSPSSTTDVMKNNPASLSATAPVSSKSNTVMGTSPKRLEQRDPSGLSYAKKLETFGGGYPPTTSTRGLDDRKTLRGDRTAERPGPRAASDPNRSSPTTAPKAQSRPNPPAVRANPVPGQSNPRSNMQKFQQDSSTQALSSSRSQSGAPGFMSQSRPLPAQAQQKPLGSRATVPAVKPVGLSSPPSHPEAGSPIGSSQAQRSAVQTQFLSSRGRSSSPAYLGEVGGPPTTNSHSNPVTARSNPSSVIASRR